VGGEIDFPGCRSKLTVSIRQDVVSTLNVQHNCHSAGCDVKVTGTVRVEREESEENNATVAHKNTVNFVVNSLELPGSRTLWEWVDLPRGEDEVNDLIPMLEEGLAAWIDAGGDDGNEGEEQLAPEAS
jgi:hypothetical protein